MADVHRSHKLAAAWFEQFQTLIRQALAKRTSRVADIDDLAQEVYLRLLRVPEPELVRNPQSYLYRVALNVAEEWRQRAAQRLTHSSDTVPELIADDDVESGVRHQERDTLVQQSLTKLSQASRTAVILHVQDGMSYDEVAAHMGVTRRAVKRYVANGYAALRNDLDVFNPTIAVHKEPVSTKEKY